MDDQLTLLKIPSGFRRDDEHKNNFPAPIAQ
jgi:hypothetical protein